MLNCIKGGILSQDRVKPLLADPSGIYHARLSCHLKKTVRKVLLTKETRSLDVRTSTTKQDSFIQQTERAAAFFPPKFRKILSRTERCPDSVCVSAVHEKSKGQDNVAQQFGGES
jgi:hypothetical protein